MERIQGKILNLQESLKSLELQPRGEESRSATENVLLGKVLTTRILSRFTLFEMVSKTWCLKARVQVEKVGENVFKFTFSSKEDREWIFKGTPWSFNGSHLNLKEWPEDLLMTSVSFGTTTFTVQIHGLPPVYLHEGTSKLIGSKIGKIHQDSVNRRSVVAQRFLKFKVDIEVENPIPAGFFQERNNGDEHWVQFKYERLSDFCYTCGVLDHVIGRCKLGNPAMVYSAQGVAAKLYGPWLRAEHTGDLKFMNPAEFESEKSKLAARGKALQQAIEYNVDRNQMGGHERQQRREECEKENPEQELQTAMEMCHELKTLNLTLERQTSGNEEEIRAALLHQMRLSNYDPQLITKWAADLVRKFASFKACEKEAVEGFNISLLQFMGHGPSNFKRACGNKQTGMGNQAQSQLRKRANPMVQEEETEALARSLQVEVATVHEAIWERDLDHEGADQRELSVESLAETSFYSPGTQFVERRRDIEEGSRTEPKSWKMAARQKARYRRHLRIEEVTETPQEEGTREATEASSSKQVFPRAEEAGHRKPPP